MVVSATQSRQWLLLIICQRWRSNHVSSPEGAWFHMEETHLRNRDKLSKLLAVLALAFCWSYKTGDYINAERPIKIKTHGRKAQTLFRGRIGSPPANL